MQENIRNLRGHVIIENSTKILQIIDKSLRLQAHPLLEIKIKNLTVIKQPDGRDVHTRYASEWAVSDVAIKVVS